MQNGRPTGARIDSGMRSSSTHCQAHDPNRGYFLLSIEDDEGSGLEQNAAMRRLSSTMPNLRRLNPLKFNTDIAKFERQSTQQHDKMQRQKLVENSDDLTESD